MDFSPENLRKRFATLTAKYDAVDKERTKLQQERDKKTAAGTLTVKEEADYAKRIMALHEKAAPVENERAMISRALGGQTSEPK